MLNPPATQTKYPYQNEPTWSKSEKTLARAAFDAALKQELQEVMRKAKQMANRISTPANLWDLERYLTGRRKHIDSKYDFRSSRLTQVLGRLLSERRVSEDQLHGLSEDKLPKIHSCARFLSEKAS